MAKLGKLLLQYGSPKIAVSFKDGVSTRKIKAARKSGMDIAEIRADLFSSYDPGFIMEELQKFRGLPTLLTVRSAKEGGKWNLPERARQSLIESLLPKVDGVDIELASKIARVVANKVIARHKTLIVSYHNFSKTPSAGTLTQIANRAKSLGAHIVKVAVMIKSERDIKTLSEFCLRNAEKNLIAIGMGAKGAVTRIAAPALGSLITFAHLGVSSAPGQLDLKTTKSLLKKFYA